MLGWRPPDFWAATPVEFWDAYAVWAEANGMTEDSGGGLNAKDVDRLQALLNADAANQRAQ